MKTKRIIKTVTNKIKLSTNNPRGRDVDLSFLFLLNSPRGKIEMDCISFFICLRVSWTRYWEKPKNNRIYKKIVTKYLNPKNNKFLFRILSVSFFLSLQTEQSCRNTFCSESLDRFQTKNDILFYFKIFQSKISI